MVRQLPETREWKKQIAGRTYGLSRRFALCCAIIYLPGGFM